MGNITMPEVEQATHLGIIRTTTMKHNIQTNVDENITKARRSAYSLFGCGFHGHNGLSVFFALMTDVIEECEGFYMNLCFYW
jgi:hypothetical protein